MISMPRVNAALLAVAAALLSVPAWTQDIPGGVDVPDLDLGGVSPICLDTITDLTLQCEDEVEYFSEFAGLDAVSIREILDEDDEEVSDVCCVALRTFNENLCNCDAALNEVVLGFVSQEDWDAVISVSAQSCNYTAIAGDLCVAAPAPLADGEETELPTDEA
eukprot:jgi/Pico_ML_1/54361/g4721.t1